MAVAKLYRYQYDPNQSIQDAMSNLWVTVVPDPDKAKEEYLPHIFRELIPGVGLHRALLHWVYRAVLTMLVCL